MKQEVVILVLDDFKPGKYIERERRWGEVIRVVHARGIDAKILAYIGGRF